MDSKSFEQIVLGPRQVFLFDTEDETVADQQRVETCLSDHIRISGLVDLKGFVQSAAPSLGLSDFQVVQYADKLDRLTRTISTLSDFFGSQSQRWRRMVQFDRAAEPTLTGSIEDPGIAEAYARLRSILSSPRPYDAVEEAWQLYQSVNLYYKKIVAQQTRQCREAALAEVDTLTRNMKNQLDRHDAKDDVRNQALYGLRTISKSIQMANGITEIHRLAEAAHEAFDVWLDTLESA